MSKDDELTKQEKQIVKIFWFKVEHILLGIIGTILCGFGLYAMLTTTYNTYSLLKAIVEVIIFIVVLILFIISVISLIHPLAFGRKFWGLDNEKKK